jgi:hypothetical protein
MSAVSLSACQRRLAAIWLIGGGLAVLMLFGFTVGNRFGSLVDRAWSWLVPTIVPTLSVVIGAIAYDARRGDSGVVVDRMAYVVAAGLSIFYFALLLGTMLVLPLVESSSEIGALQFFSSSNYWLGPTQGLVGIALGAFFASGTAAEK